MKRYGIYFDAELQRFYLDESVHNHGVLLSAERKDQYDKAVKVFDAWQYFLWRKVNGLPTRKPK